MKVMRNKNRKVILPALVLAILLAAGMLPVTAVRAEETAAPSVTGIRMSKSSMTMEFGAEQTLNAVLLPEGAAAEAVWESDDPEVVSVRGEGTRAVVTAGTEEGYATVTVRAGACEAYCAVYVSEKMPLISDMRFSAGRSESAQVFELALLSAEDNTWQLTVPSNVGEVYAQCHTKTGKAVSVECSYVNCVTGEEKTRTLTESAQRLSFLLQADSGDATRLRLTAQDGADTEEYTILVRRIAELANVEFAGVNGQSYPIDPEFSSDQENYVLFLPENTEKLQLNMMAAAANCNAYYVNGTETTEASLAVLDGEMRELVLSCKGAGLADAREYHFVFSEYPVCRAEFITEPENALVMVWNENGERVSPKGDGSFELTRDNAYTYRVSAQGYASAEGTFLADGDTVLNAVLEEKEPDPWLPVFEAEWPGLFQNGDNRNVVTERLPSGAEETRLLWEVSGGEMSGMSLVNGYLCVYDKSSLMLFDAETGSMRKSAALASAGNPSDSLCPVYGAGMIYVPLKDGRVQAFNAQNLKPCWIFEAPSGGEVRSVTYADGFLYCVTEDALYCVDTADEDLIAGTNLQEAYWSFSDGTGFSDCVPLVTGEQVILGSRGGSLYGLNRGNGLMESRLVLEDMGAVRYGAVRDGGSVWAATENGWLVRVGMNGEKLNETDSGVIRLGGCISSASAILNGTVYAVSSEGSATSSYRRGQGPWYLNAVTAGADGLPEVTGRTELAGGAAGNLLAGTDGLLFTAENLAGSAFYSIGVKNGTAADSTLLLEGIREGHAAGTIAVGTGGKLYVRTDAGKILCLVREELRVLTVSVTDPGAVIDGGRWNDALEEHEIILSGATERTVLTVTVADGVEISVNGVPGNSAEIITENGRAEAEVLLSAGGSQRLYRVRFRCRYSDTALNNLCMTSSPHPEAENAYRFLPLEELSEETEVYTIEYNRTVNNGRWYLWVEADYEKNASVELLDKTGGVITAIPYDAVRSYYQVNMTSQKEGETFRIRVTAEDGTEKLYTLNLVYNVATPSLDGETPLFTDRGTDSVNIHVNADAMGYLYYLVYEQPPVSVPTAAEYRANGMVAEQKLQAGSNTLTLTGIGNGEVWIYAIMADMGGNWSRYSLPVYGAVEQAPEVKTEGVALSCGELLLNFEETGALTASVYPADTTESVRWRWAVSESGKLMLTENGNTASLTALNFGTVTVTVTAETESGCFTDSCEVTVPMTLRSIGLSEESVKVRVGENIFLKLLLNGVAEDETGHYRIRWVTGDKSVIEVGFDTFTATVKGVAAGKTLLEAIVDSFSVYCEITVYDFMPGDVNMDGAVDIFDAVAIRDMLRGTVAPDLMSADMDGSGEIDENDVDIVLEMINK